MTNIIFVCNDCRDYNKHHKDDSNFMQKDYEFESLTEVFNEHIARNHSVTTRIEESDD